MQGYDLVYDIINKNVGQKHETLSLIDISPRWAKRLEEKQSLPFLMPIKWLQWLSEIIDPQKCVVGEAYGFSSSYANTCAECTSLANKFPLYFAICSHKKLGDLEQTFVKHWNEKHACI
jgi:diphthamide biosynthesis methyltransferase